MQQQAARCQNNFSVEITIPFKTTSVLLTAILTDQFSAGFSRMFVHLGISSITSTLKIKNLKSSRIVFSLRYILLLQKIPQYTKFPVSVLQQGNVSCQYQHQSQVLLESF